ncbi:MAG TPA: ATP-binding protein [Fibrobacteria bacterium]|nr:ATP-binding protein [Fibrobacteria bacterium]
MHKYVPRLLEPSLRESLAKYPIVALLGPRQCGKSTLAKKILSRMGRVVYLDLERPSDRAKLQDPEAYFEANKGALICLDEVQRAPEIFPVLRAIVDERGKPGQFLVLGSASRDLLQQSSETLAGRIAYLELTPFTALEMPSGAASLRHLWLRGGFPKSLQAANDSDSFQWRLNFIRTFLERDVPAFAPGFSPASIERLWSMCAHWHGQLANYSRLAASLGVTDHTVRSWLDLLANAFVIRLLPPFSANLGKRLVKAPKIYLRDSGLLHALLGLESEEDLHGHPVYGASWEGFALENVLARLRPGVRASFYRDSNGTEIDLVLEKGAQRMAAEFKAGLSPDLTRTFANALEALGSPKAFVVSRSPDAFPLAKGVLAMPLAALLESGEAREFLVTRN